MPMRRNMLTLICVLALAAGATHAAEPVLSYVPADTMMYMVVPEVEAATLKAEAFLNEIGVGPMMGLQPGRPGALLMMLQMQTQLGEGFNPDDGFGFVMLDPQQFGIDMVEMMETGPAPDQKLPFILLVPGSSIDAVFARNYEVVDADAADLKQVNLRMGPMMAKQIDDGMIALSPDSKYIEAMQAGEKQATAALTNNQTRALDGADLGMYLNMDIVGPMYIKMMEQAQQQMQQMGPMGGGAPMAGLMTAVMPFYRDMMSQTDSLLITGRFADTGLVFDEWMTFKEGSDYAKMAKDYEPADGELLNLLPDLPYVLAMGGTNEGISEQSKEMALEMWDRLAKSDALAEISDPHKQQIRKLMGDFYDQVKGAQFVGGPAPGDAGVFGLAYTIRCKDAAAVRKMLAEAADLGEALVKQLAADEPDVDKLDIAYVANAGQADGTPYDVIAVTHPEMDDMSETDRAEMTQVVGEDQVQLRVASADDDAVVITFGGGDAMLTAALNAARSDEGAIMQGEQIDLAMKHMPKDRVQVVLFNAGNLLEAVAAGARKIDPQAQIPPMRLSKTPVAIGAGVSGNEMVATLYVPTALARDLATQLMPMLMMMGGGGQQMQPMPQGGGNQDF